MILKRIFIAAAVLANVIVFIMPGMMLFVTPISEVIPAPKADEIATPLAWRGIGLLVALCGVTNLLCMYLAHKSRGRRRLIALLIPLFICFLLMTSGFVLGSYVGHPLPKIVLGALACVMAAGLVPLLRASRPEHFCANCEYDMTGCPTTVCPECGMDANDGTAT